MGGETHAATSLVKCMFEVMFLLYLLRAVACAQVVARRPCLSTALLLLLKHPAALKHCNCTHLHNKRKDGCTELRCFVFCGFFLHAGGNLGGGSCTWPADRLPCNIPCWQRERTAGSWVGNAGDYKFSSADSRKADMHVHPPHTHTSQGMLDVLVFAARSRGDGADAVARALAGLVAGAVAQEVGRQVAGRVAPGMSGAAS